MRKPIQQSLQAGYTLIELMIVVAIIGILLVIAIPAYQDYVARSEVTEAMSLIDGLKIDTTEYWATNGSCPVQGTTAGFVAATSISGKYVASVAIATGAANSGAACTFTATFKAAGNAAAQIAGKTFVVNMTPPAAGAQGTVTYNCNQSVTGGTVPDNVLPTACK